MTVEMGSFLYFVFMFAAFGVIIGLYFLLRNKSQKTIKIVLFSMLAFNFLLHFSRAFYASSASDFLSAVSFRNLCATSVLFFPFIFLSKNQTWRDYMIYMGIFSGLGTLIFPEGVLGDDMTRFDSWRFYICHSLLLIVSALMLLLKVQKLDYRRIWKMPFCALFMFLIIMINSVLLSELGITAARSGEVVPNYDNESLVWYPDRAAGPFLTWLTPEFMKTIPFGPHAGEAKYWPFLWLVCPVFFYGLVGCFLLALPFEWKHIKEDFTALKQKIQNRKNKDSI